MSEEMAVNSYPGSCASRPISLPKAALWRAWSIVHAMRLGIATLRIVAERWAERWGTR